MWLFKIFDNAVYNFFRFRFEPETALRLRHWCGDVLRPCTIIVDITVPVTGTFAFRRNSHLLLPLSRYRLNVLLTGTLHFWKKGVAVWRIVDVEWDYKNRYISTGFWSIQNIRIRYLPHICVWHTRTPLFQTATAPKHVKFRAKHPISGFRRVLSSPDRIALCHYTRISVYLCHQRGSKPYRVPRHWCESHERQSRPSGRLADASCA